MCDDALSRHQRELKYRGFACHAVVARSLPFARLFATPFTISIQQDRRTAHARYRLMVDFPLGNRLFGTLFR